MLDIFDDSLFNWYRSEFWDYIEKMKRGEVSGTLIRQEPPVTAEGIKIYSIKDISGLTEKQKRGLGIYRHINTRNDGVKEYSGVKINPRRFDVRLYDYSDLKMSLRPETLFQFAPDGRVHWTLINLPENFDSAWLYLIAVYTKIWTNNLTEKVREDYIKSMLLSEKQKDRWLEQRKVWARQRKGTSAGISKFPRDYLFKMRWHFQSPHLYFAILHTVGVFCGLIKPGETWEQSPGLWGTFGPVFSMEFSVGVPKSVEPGDVEGLLKEGLVGEIRFFDPEFPVSQEGARMFELFKVGLTLLGADFREMGFRDGRDIQHLIGAFECPTANVIRFPLIRPGTFLYRDFVRDIILTGKVNRIRLRCHNMTAFQGASFVPPIGGFPSHLSYVTVPLGKPFDPGIKFETGER